MWLTILWLTCGITDTHTHTHAAILSKLRYWQTKGNLLGNPPSFQIPFTPESEYQLVIKLFSAPKLLLGSFLFQKVFSSFHCCPSVQPHSPSANLKPPIQAGFPAFPPATVLSWIVKLDRIPNIFWFLKCNDYWIVNSEYWIVNILKKMFKCRIVLFKYTIHLLYSYTSALNWGWPHKQDAGSGSEETQEHLHWMGEDC